MQNVLITGGAGYVGHVLTPRWGAGVRPIDCAELPTGRFAHAIGGPGRIPDKLDLDPSGEGTFQSSLLCRRARRTATLVMVSCIASRTAPGSDPIRSLSLLLRL
jgi:nucleoside-diphosphate-sugar epimerase